MHVSSLTRPSAVLLALVLFVAGCSGAAETADPSADSTRVQPEVPRTIPVVTQAQRRTGLNPDTVQAGRFDEGRMWTFEYPPTSYFEETYDLTLDDEWLRRARLGTLRIPGCTASFASPNGLLLTNHHCGRGHATSVAQPDEDLLTDGFYAESMSGERRVEGLYADQLIAIQDVTARVEEALATAQTDAERAEAREAVTQEIVAERTQAAGGGDDLRVEVIALYNGGRYSAYTFRRYEDVRLVFIPELGVGYFGGDPDNFTYPRYTLDMSLFRVYGDDGQPLQNEVYFPWKAEGAQAGDAVFVVGNPGSTLRLSTVAQLEYRRDVQDRALLDFLDSRIAALEAFAEEAPAEAEQVDARNRIFSLKNARKLYRGRLTALRDPYIVARRQAAQSAFEDSVASVPELREEYGGLIGRMTALQGEKRAEAGATQAFMLLGNPAYSSATMVRAMAAARYLRQQAEGGAGPPADEVRQQILGVPQQPDALDRRYLAARLTDLDAYLPDEAAAVLNGRSPEAAARQIVQGSVLSDSTRTAQALADGSLSADDPAVQLVEAVYARYRDNQSAMAGLSEQEQELARQLGRARFAVYGTDVPPDATFSLRLADGVVRGYDYNGTTAPPFTTVSGLYGHHYAYGEGTAWDLPQRWLDRQDAIDLSTKMNLVSTNDITGGNSGSPLLDRNLELVGLIFDGNIESLSGDFIFLPDRTRAVSVDVRAMLEALRVVYGAERLVYELREGTLVRSDGAVPSTTAR